jgi:hypothetical protein
MTVVQFKHPLSDSTKLFTRLQFLNIFNAGGNIKSYQWVRLGLDIKNFQFGLAMNLDEYGPSPSVEGSLGIFFRKELF